MIQRESQCLTGGRMARRSGFTLMELLIVVAIIVILAGFGIFYLVPRLGEARADVAKAQVKGNLTHACELYKIRIGQNPPSLEVLAQQLPNGDAPILDPDGLLDPWGHPYGYDASGGRNGGLRPDIWATNPDTGEQIGNWPRGH